jgi:lipopolysaccharide heptosyltransferase II
MNENWQQATNILCVRLDALGDLLMTTPAMRALKGTSAARRITLLASLAGAEVAALVPEVDSVIAYEAPWMKATAPRPDSQPDFAMIERLKESKFDAAVIFTVYSQNPLPAAFMCYLADIPLRLAHCRENPYQLLTDWVPDLEPDRMVRHEVRRQLDLVARVGSQTDNERLSLRVGRSDLERAAHILDNLGVDRKRPWIIIHPGATAASRRYPPESFAAAGRRLVLEFGIQPVFTGSAQEAALIDCIRSLLGDALSYSLAGQLNLRELVALIALAPLLISNNTGPAHIAAAVGTPVVDLYALTNPQHIPWQVPHRVLSHDVACKYCYKSICPEGHHNCLRLVTPDQVVWAALELLHETSPGLLMLPAGATRERPSAKESCGY